MNDTTYICIQPQVPEWLSEQCTELAICSLRFESGLETDLYSKISSIYVVNHGQLPFIYWKLLYTIIDSCFDFITSYRLLCGITVNKPIFTGQFLTIYRLRNGTFLTSIETIHGRGHPDIIRCLHRWSHINLRSPDGTICLGAAIKLKINLILN